MTTTDRTPPRPPEHPNPYVGVLLHNLTPADLQMLRYDRLHHGGLYLTGTSPDSPTVSLDVPWGLGRNALARMRLLLERACQLTRVEEHRRRSALRNRLLTEAMVEADKRSAERAAQRAAEVAG